MAFNYDLDQMKKAIESGIIAIPSEALTSFESFNEWLAEDATSIDEIKKQLIKGLNNDN